MLRPISLMKSFKKPLVAAVTAASLGLSVTTPVDAGHCGCRSHAHHPIAVSRPACRCDCGGKTNCLEKALDSFSASLDRLFGLGKSGCDEMSCDDACDAAMIEDLMTPMPPMMDGSTQSQPRPAETIPPAPRTDNGRRDDSPSVVEEVSPEDADGSPIEQVPPPVRLDQRNIPPQENGEKEEEGSLFDTLSDPFGDDEAKTESFRTIRPSAYQQPAASQPSKASRSSSALRTVELEPVPRRPLPTQGQPWRRASRSR